MRIVRLQGSDAISEVRYDLINKKMRLKFPKTKSVWEYADVAEADFASIILSTSPGQVFNNLVRDHYKGVRLVPPPLDGS